MRRKCRSDDKIADDAGVNPAKQQLLRQLKAGESVLTRVRQEKNDLLDANTKLGVELKDVRAHCRTLLRRIDGFGVAYLVSA